MSKHTPGYEVTNAADREAHGRTYRMTTEEARRKAKLSALVRRTYREGANV